MKKIISILLVIIFLSTSFSFGAGGCTLTSCPGQKILIKEDGGCWCEDPAPLTTPDPAAAANTAAGAAAGAAATTTPTTTTKTTTSPGVMGIECSPTQLTNGQCKLSIYDTLGIRKSVRNEGDPTSVGLFVQDVVLSATFFIGTLVTIALVVSGLMFIFAASSGKDPANAKKGIINSLIGLLIVVSSYVIIRLVQYIAKGF